MNEAICPGLPGDWVNSWLAALGTTVLAPELRLHWTKDALPVAVLSACDADPVDVLVAAWPDEELIADLPIAKDWNKGGQYVGELGRQVPVKEFIKRAQLARGHKYSWCLTSTMTDLCVNEKGEVGHAPFDPPVPRGVTLYERLKKVQACFDDPKDRIPKSLSGRGKRERVNGLGFDQTRIGSQADETGKLTDPVIEVLAFFGLAFLTARGPAADARLTSSADTTVRQRCWRKDSGERRFYWPAWGRCLDRDAIDALLDVWDPGEQRKWSLYGVHAAWISVRFETDSTSDATRAFGAERLP